MRHCLNHLKMDETSIRAKLRQTLVTDEETMPSRNHEHYTYYYARQSMCSRIIGISYGDDRRNEDKLGCMKQVLMNNLNAYRRNGTRWDQLPCDIFDDIIQYLHPVDVLNCRLTCRVWYDHLYWVDYFIFHQECKAMLVKQPGLKLPLDELPYSILDWKNQFNVLMNWMKGQYHFVSKSSDFMIPKSISGDTMTTTTLVGKRDPLTDRREKRAVAVIPFAGQETCIFSFCEGFLYSTDTSSDNETHTIYRLRMDGRNLGRASESAVWHSKMPVISILPESCERLAFLDTQRQFLVLKLNSFGSQDPKKIVARAKAPGYTCAFDGYSKTFAFLGPSPDNPFPEYPGPDSNETEKEYYHRLYDEDKHRHSKWHEMNNTLYVYTYKDEKGEDPSTVLTHQVTLAVSEWTDIPEWKASRGLLAMRGDIICIGYSSGLYVLLKKNPETLQYDCAMKLYEKDLDIHSFTYAPNVMYFGAHFLVTNGGYPDELLIWNLNDIDLPDLTTIQNGREMHWKNPDLRDKEESEAKDTVCPDRTLSLLPLNTEIRTLQSTTPRYKLSETIAMKRKGVYVPPFRDLDSSAYIDRDETSIFCATRHNDESHILLVWDFRGNNVFRAYDRHFVKRRIDTMQFWFVYDIISKED